MWGRGSAVFSSVSLGGGERWQRLTEERFEGAAELYKICDAADGGCRYEVGCRAGGRLKDCRGGEIFVKNAAAQNEVRAIGSRTEDFAGIEHKNKSYDEIKRQKEQIRKKLGITGGNDDFEFDGGAADFWHNMTGSAATDRPRAESTAATDSDASARGSQYAEDIVRLSAAVSELKAELARLKSYIKFINGKSGAKISAKHNKNI